MSRADSTLTYPDIPARMRQWWRVRASSVARNLVTSALVRWTWSDLGEGEFAHVLTDYRPCDIDTVREMMAGRYLLAAKLVDTNGVSPFSITTRSRDWHEELQSFSWLRHFRDARQSADRQFARTLTLDWIGRNRQFDSRTWSVSLTAQRVLNWLRHLDLLLDDTPPVQVRTIKRMLNQQIQSLRVRARLISDPTEALHVRMALLGAALAQGEGAKGAEIISQRLDQLHALLDAQFDADGLHLSRNPDIQVRLLTELITLRNALARRQSAERLGGLIAKMHSALAQLTLGTGELAYFNGCGQQQVDLLYALHAQGHASLDGNRTLSGYGIIRERKAVIIADAGKVPPPPFAKRAHAGALSFEFSHGNELIIGNCGPAPAELENDAHLFRLAAAHSAPSIDAQSTAHIAPMGALGGALLAHDPAPRIELSDDEPALYLRTGGFHPRFKVMAERWLTLISNGDTLVGKDRFSAPKAGALKGDAPKATVTLRFHLGPGVRVERTSTDTLMQVHLPSSSQWTFLWEGAEARIEESVRHSAHFGFHRTRQIVLETPLRDDLELVWVLTRQV